MRPSLASAFAILTILLLAACGSPPAETPLGPASGDPSSAGAFDDLIEEITRTYFEQLPEMATYVGAPEDLAPGAASRLGDRSPAAETARRQAMEAALARLRAFDGARLESGRRITRDSLINLLDGALMPARLVGYGATFAEYGLWFHPYPVVQLSGPTVSLPKLLEAQHGVASQGDAENYLARLSAYAATLEGALEKIRHDAALGVVPPDFVIEKSRAVLERFAAPEPRDNLLVGSFADKLEQAGIEDAEALVMRAAEILEAEILPAHLALDEGLRELLRDAPHDAGVWRLPDGPALYRAMIRHMTDAERSPEEIHQTGLDEVERILAEMDAILRTEGYEAGTVAERFVRIGREERFAYSNTDADRAAIMDDIDDQLAEIEQLLPRWIGTLPEYGVEVRAVPEFNQGSAPIGYYDLPALDGSRPGIYWINLRDMTVWSKINVPTLTYHEALPGHHLQLALSLGREQPLLLTAIGSNASVEGWALYAEKLAAEMGVYDGDPYGDLGRLQSELHRAVRLVVDTGMHAMKWSREQAIAYVIDTEGAHETDAVAEVERYAVWPGQALGYKLGMLHLEALRIEAETALGEAFDIRAFHDQVLRVGSAPQPVIEHEIRAWIGQAGSS